MAEQDIQTKDFALEDFKLKPISSTENTKAKHAAETSETGEQSATGAKTLGEETAASNDKDESAETENPIFKELSAPKLPELPKENRARLQMQSPNKVYFYWSFRENPFKILNRVFGGQTGYQLVAKLLNQTSGREEVFPIDAEGSAWFDVDADARSCAFCFPIRCERRAKIRRRERITRNISPFPPINSPKFWTFPVFSRTRLKSRWRATTSKPPTVPPKRRFRKFSIRRKPTVSTLISRVKCGSFCWRWLPVTRSKNCGRRLVRVYTVFCKAAPTD